MIELLRGLFTWLFIGQLIFPVTHSLSKKKRKPTNYLIPVSSEIFMGRLILYSGFFIGLVRGLLIELLIGLFTWLSIGQHIHVKAFTHVNKTKNKTGVYVCVCGCVRSRTYPNRTSRDLKPQLSHYQITFTRALGKQRGAAMLE